MWTSGWRDAIWGIIDQEWDVIIIGGGITGAGILREAVNAGYKALLLEANDFAFGTSSRSSKLIHGGFRYLRNKQYDVTKESVREREWMLKEADNLVTPLQFFLPDYIGSKTPRWQLKLGVVIYDFYGRKWDHKHYNAKELLENIPIMNPNNLAGAYRYCDAQMDDSRMVIRILKESVENGGYAINYAKVSGLLRGKEGRVCGVIIRDRSEPNGREFTAQAKVVINAAGPWSDEIRAHIQKPAHLRKSRGSHLIFPRAKFPLKYAVTLGHPKDNRAMFAIPWEGTTMIGTTDLDHPLSLEKRQDEPCASMEEIAYIMEALHNIFPTAEVTQADMISSFAGLRPIISTGKANPSDESRGHAVWEEDGLLTIAGGKYTTFRIMAADVLNLARPHLPEARSFPTHKRIIGPIPNPFDCGLDLPSWAYLSGRYGFETPEICACAKPGELEKIEQLPNFWAELRWAAQSDGIIHLDDLLLRRVRIGMLLPNGALDSIEKIRSIVQPELGWNDARWQSEVNAYRAKWERSYSPNPLG
jgi:glycerol-3-phosphate dehydrogenase